MKPPGFDHEGYRIMFIEPCGKDVSFNRWRFHLYYAPNFAVTHFEPSAKTAAAFMAHHAGKVYADYTDYRSAQL